MGTALLVPLGASRWLVAATLGDHGHKASGENGLFWELGGERGGSLGHCRRQWSAGVGERDKRRDCDIDTCGSRVRTSVRAGRIVLCQRGSKHIKECCEYGYVYCVGVNSFRQRGTGDAI